MRFLSLILLGLRRALRHPWLVLLVYLATLLPALLVLSPLSTDLAPALDRSLFAERLLSGESFPPWIEFLSSDANDSGPLQGSLPGRFLLVVLLQILLVAGAVEVLLEREARAEVPFLLGVGRHGWRFVRSALVFAVSAAAAVGLARAVSLAFRGGDDKLQVIGWGVSLLVGLLLYLLLDLGYDLSRIAAAAHFEGRMFVGFFKALGFVFRHLGVLLPLYAVFGLLMVGLHVGYIAARASWWVTDAGRVAVAVAVQQLLFLLLAFLRTAFWGAEIVYFQGVGEPRFCGGLSLLQRRRARREPRPKPARRAEAPSGEAPGERRGVTDSTYPSPASDG